MKFKIKKEIFLDGLTKVQGLTGKKSNLAVTSNVLLSIEQSTGQSTLSLAATDLEIAFRGNYKAEIEQEGATLIPSRKLYEIIRNFPSDTVTVKELENKWIQITDKELEYNIVGMETSDFPDLPDIEGVPLFKIDADILKEMIEKTIYAVSTDEGRTQLSGIYFETVSEDDNRKIRMVSTDGHRLSKIDSLYRQAKDGDFTLEKGVIIPKAGVVEILKLLEGGDRVYIGCKGSNYVVKKGDEYLIVRLIEGEFPDYKMVIPKETHSELKVNRDTFIAMLKRMSILASDRYKGVHFKISKNRIESSISNPEVGESREVIAAELIGDELNIGFNPRYLIETLNAMKSDEIIIKFTDEINPSVIEGKDDKGFLSLIMPMRIQNGS